MDIYFDVIMAGFGGQGILLIGNLLALAAMNEGKNVTWMPSYGVEMRGGVARCTVVISTDRIGSPITNIPHGAVIMNMPSLEKYAPTLRPGGVMIANGSFISEKDVKRNDLDCAVVPTTGIAEEIGDSRLASMVALGAFIQRAKVVSLDTTVDCLKGIIPPKRHEKMLGINGEALRRGHAFAAEAKGSSKK